MHWNICSALFPSPSRELGHIWIRIGNWADALRTGKDVSSSTIGWQTEGIGRCASHAWLRFSALENLNPARGGSAFCCSGRFAAHGSVRGEWSPNRVAGTTCDSSPGGTKLSPLLYDKKAAWLTGKNQVIDLAFFLRLSVCKFGRRKKKLLQPPVTEGTNNKLNAPLLVFWIAGQDYNYMNIYHYLYI
jgi:hypothetical protein